jgi:hypothetical protein
MRSYERSISVWDYGGTERGLWVVKIESWLFGDLVREVHQYVILHQVQNLKLCHFLLIVNILFAHSKDTVDSSFKIRRLLKFAYCVTNVVL